VPCAERSGLAALPSEPIDVPGELFEGLPALADQRFELKVTGVFRYTDTWPVAAHLVATSQVDLASLITGRFDLDHAEEALNAYRTPGSLKVMVRP
jgi:L-iditol 2-dehydrogenase